MKSSSSIFSNIILILLSAVFIIPIITIISISISNEGHILKMGYSILPNAFDLTAYKYIFESPKIIVDAYKVTTIVSVLGAVTSLLIMTMCAYALARRNFKYRRMINIYLFIPLLFNSGLVPKYILMTQYLNLQNTIWVMILNSLVSVWYIFILRTFIQSIPEEILESALLDGASEFRIFANIIIPLSKPSLATIGLLVLLSYWNEWMTALLYINVPSLYPLQYLLQKILQNTQEVLKDMNSSSGMRFSDQNAPTETIRMALSVVAAGPMLFIMPFFQKHFVRGMTIGSVKG